MSDALRKADELFHGSEGLDLDAAYRSLATALDRHR